MDGRVRIWNIPEKRVAFWNEVPGFKHVTAVGFTLDGKTVIAGSDDGYCYFFETQGLKYNTQISIRAKKNKKRGPKVTGIEVMPGMPPGEEKILITTNDSRVRLFNMKDKSLMFKYKGILNTSLQIKATFRYFFLQLTNKAKLIFFIVTMHVISFVDQKIVMFTFGVLNKPICPPLIQLKNPN